MIDFTKPVRTIGSKLPVRILVIDRELARPVIGVIENRPGVDAWFADGRMMIEPSVLDLENYEAQSDPIVIKKTLLDVVTRSRAVLTDYLRPEGCSAEEAIQKLLEIVDGQPLMAAIRAAERGEG